MMRLPRGVPAIVALLGLAAVAAAPADAKVKRQSATPKTAVTSRPAKFPVYLSQGPDRNPGGDNLYYTDTKSPAIFNGPNLIGPAWFQRWWGTY